MIPTSLDQVTEFHPDSPNICSRFRSRLPKSVSINKRGDPLRTPGNLKFDGKTSWFSFKKLFDSYRSVYNWCDQECRDYLTWSLEGKALDYFTIATRMGEDYSFDEILKKLESRFGSCDLTETTRVHFQNASQKNEESLEDWADRVM